MTASVTPPSALAGADTAGAPSATSPAPRVSVVIPSYNRVELLQRAIDSALNQTYRDIELIVVDDGSDDGTSEMIERIPDPRVRLVRHRRPQGVARARNAGIAIARGEWVAFLDNDDEWLPEKLERQLALVEQEDPGVAAVYCSAFFASAPGERRPMRRRNLPRGDVLDSLLRHDMPTTPTLYMVRRSALIEIGGFDDTALHAEDLDCWIRLARASYRFAVVDQPLAVWHADHGLDQITADPVALLIAFRNTERRWGSLMEQRLGAEFHKRWVGNRDRRMHRRHKKLMRQIARSGRRSEGWRYVRRMLPFLPWGTRYVARTLAFVLLGRSLYRTACRRLAAIGDRS